MDLKVRGKIIELFEENTDLEFGRFVKNDIRSTNCKRKI